MSPESPFQATVALFALHLFQVVAAVFALVLCMSISDNMRLAIREKEKFAARGLLRVMHRSSIIQWMLIMIVPLAAMQAYRTLLGDAVIAEVATVGFVGVLKAEPDEAAAFFALLFASVVSTAAFLLLGGPTKRMFSWIFMRPTWLGVLGTSSAIYLGVMFSALALFAPLSLTEPYVPDSIAELPPKAQWIYFFGFVSLSSFGMILACFVFAVLGTMVMAFVMSCFEALLNMQDRFAGFRRQQLERRYPAPAAPSIIVATRSTPISEWPTEQVSAGSPLTSNGQSSHATAP